MAHEAQIHVFAKSGKVKSCKDDQGADAVKLTEAELLKLEKAYESDHGVRHVATIVHTDLSPGCVIIIIGGVPYKICF